MTDGAKNDICAASQGHQTRSQGLKRQYNVRASLKRIVIDIAGSYHEKE